MHVASQTSLKMLFPSSLPSLSAAALLSDRVRKKLEEEEREGSFEENIQRRNGMQTDEPKRKPRDVFEKGEAFA